MVSIGSGGAISRTVRIHLSLAPKISGSGYTGCKKNTLAPSLHRRRPLCGYPSILFRHNIHRTSIPSCTRHASSVAVIEGASVSDGVTGSKPEAASALGSPTDWATPFDLISASSTSTDPYIGYLKELGLDFGWGPTSLIQWGMESLQVGFSMPVWAAALGITVAVRLLVLPLAFEASDTSARMRALTPKIAPLRSKILEAAQSQDRAAQVALSQEMKSIYKAAKIKPMKMFWPLLVQAPLGFGLFRLTRSMADLPVPGLDMAGFSWISNLAVPDPFYAIPAATAGLMWFTMRRGVNDSAPAGAEMSSMRTFMINGLPLVTLAVTSYMPALTQIGFAMASLFQFTQAEALRHPMVRRKLRLHPLVPILSEKDAKSYKGTLTTEESFHAAQSPSQRPDALSRVVDAPREAIRSMKSSANNLMQKAKSANEKKHGRLSSSELKSAQSYETSRKSDEEAMEERRKEQEREQRLKRLRR